MQALLLERSSVVQAALLSSVTVVAVALLGLVLAYWTWAWFAPRVEPRVSTASAPAGTMASARALFGHFQRQQATAPTGINIRLLGIAAAAGNRRGHAVVQLDAKQILVVEEGDDVAPGVKLVDVRADHAVLERGGVRERLEWPKRKATAPPIGRPAAPAPANAPNDEETSERSARKGRS